MKLFTRKGVWVGLFLAAALVTLYAQEPAMFERGITIVRGNLAIAGTTSSTISFEGATGDAFETRILVTDPTADRDWTIPDSASDTFVGLAATQTLTNKTLTTPVLGAATGTSFQASSFIKSSSAAATGGIGYSTGAGGTATQITNRSTGVTMSPNPCMSGTITTTTTSLAGLATADFIVTDSAVAIGDTVVVSIQSGSNSGAAIVSVAIVTAGTFTIRVSNTNAAAGTAETGAIIINFAIIKAVSA